MTKASDNEFPSVLLDEQASAPTTPATGFWRLYTKSDGLYIVNDAGTETGPFAISAGSVSRVGARVYITAAQSIANNTVVIVPWDAESFDDDTMVDLGTSATRVTIKTAGRFDITGSAQWASNTTGERLIDLMLNGTTILGRTAEGANPTGAHSQSVQAGAVDLSVNDYIEMRIRQQSGGNLNLAPTTLGDPGSVFLSVQQVA